MIKKIISLSLVAASSISASALTAEDFCDPLVSRPAGIKEMRPLNDGLSFAAISDDGKSIEVFSYKTGEKMSTLFSIEGIKGDIKIPDFDGYQISDNEKKILLWTNRHKIYRNSFYADYYVYDILRSTLRPVSTEGAQRGATMSHDGRMVAYMRGNNLFVSNIDYGSDKQITTDGEEGKIIYGCPDWAYEEEFDVLNTIRWNSDDTVLAFMRFDESEVPTYSFDDYQPFSPEKPLGELYPRRYSYKYPLAGYPNSRVEVLAYNVDMQTTKKMGMTLGDSYIPSLEFDGKGENLMTMVLNRDQNELLLYRVNPKSTVAHLILTLKSDSWLSPSAYKMVRYYDNSFVIGNDASGFRHLHEYDYNGNPLRQLTKGDWYVTAYYGKSKSGIHYFQSTVKGAINRNVCAVDLNGKMTVLNDVDGTESASFSKNHAYFVRTYSTALNPPVYSICKASGEKIKMLELNDKYALKYADAPKTEFLKVKNAAGEDMDAFIIKPNGFDPSKKYPLLMYQYNGPESQIVLNQWKMDGIFYIADQGYVVCAVDGRGTGNKSVKWSSCVYKNLGFYETEDQLAAADYFSSLPYIDSGKTACFGWSYGGYMTLMETAHPKCRFKAGVAMAPVTDWHFYDSIYTERYMLTPQQNPSGYESSSALLKSGNVKASLLLMSGTSDDNVHYYNTLKYSSKLNYEGKIFDMMSFAGFDHSLRIGNARTQLYRNLVNFLNLNVKN